MMVTWYPRWKIYQKMFVRGMNVLFNLFLVYSGFFIGFAMLYHLLFPHEETYQYPVQAALKILVMMKKGDDSLFGTTDEGDNSTLYTTNWIYEGNFEEDLRGITLVWGKNPSF